MKKKRRLKFKNIFIFIFLILIITFLIMYIPNYIKTNNTTLIAETHNVEENKTKFLKNITYGDYYDSEDFVNVEDKIISLMNLYFESMYYLETKDFTTLFSDSNSDEAYFTNKAFQYLVDIRHAAINDLTLTDASYNIELVSIKKDGSNYVVEVLEDNTVKFKFLDKYSNYYDIESTYTFNSNYELISYRKYHDFYSSFISVINDNFDKSDVNNLYDTLYTKKLENINEQKEMLKEYNETPVYTSNATCDYVYDRSSAYEYLTTYVTKRNYDDWSVYDPYGGNCQNFASQVVYAGGIPMDTSGSSVWKWYGETPDNTSWKGGRSSSWTGVNSFYTYAKNNYGYGLCSEVDINYFYAESGDIMQVGYNDEYAHTIVVNDRIIENNYLIDILLNGNTMDYENIPLSSLGSSDIRLIKINGYNL